MARRPKTAAAPAEPADIRERIQSGITRPGQSMPVLSPDHLRQLNQVIEECTRTQDMCARCIDAGVDVSPEASINAEQLDMARKLKAYFFPHAT